MVCVLYAADQWKTKNILPVNGAEKNEINAEEISEEERKGNISENE